MKLGRFFALRSLFLKIFVSFWLTMALIIGVLNLMFRISNMESMPEKATHGAVGEGLTLFGETAARTYQKEGPQALAELARRAARESGTEIFLFDASGRPINSNPPDSVTSVVRDLQLHGQQQRPVPLFSPGVARSVWARYVNTQDGNRFIFAARFSRPGTPPAFLSPTRIAVAILIVGLVCYLLGLYLTLPLKKLQSTVKAFAEGNLEARVAPELGNRRDELADLGREFDHMAERIAALISSQKRLLADISHELRSPLARLTVALELARKNTDGRAIAALDRIEQESERVNKLVGQLLALTRLESGAERVPPETVALEEIVQQIIDDADFEAKATHRQVHAIQLDQCKVRGSAELLRSAVENVVRNGVRYTPEGTSVEVALHWKLDTAVFTVRDYGPGVPESDLEQIFQPFYRVSEARERTSGGVGLGLSIAERTAKLHGGSIRAANAHPGLLVTMELPLAPSAPAAEPVPEKQAISN